MSAVTLLKHVFTFGKILGDAASDVVRSWDVTAVENAMQWAVYCEKICSEARGKPFENFLSSQLRRMALLENPPSRMYLSLSDLSRARSVLRETLLLNPKCNLTVVEYFATRTDFDDAGRYAQIEGNLRLSEEIIQFLTSEPRLSSDSPCFSISSEDFIEVQSVMLRDAIQAQAESCSSKQEINSHIKSIAKVMSTNCQSLGILVGCVSALSNGGACSENSGPSPLSMLLDWLRKFCTEHPAKLLEVHPNLLSKVAESSAQFCDIYTHSLELALSALQAETVQKDCDVLQMNSAPNLWPWRTKTEFRKLLQHFRSLCCGCEHLSLVVQQLVHDRCLEQPSVFNIWSDISKALKSD